MTSAEIRRSFLDFFREKQHTIVPSSSLLPDAPNLLFTNAGMNQFVPIFLGQRAPDVDKWAGAVPGSPTRAADTQKCIRAGGKHNDLEDVGLDTYHHTFFEMLGNWSFGDYFKKEAIDWAWELVVRRWHFPRERLYATYFQGDDKAPADIESRDLWKRYLPESHVVPGNRKDNFWMMADTGPCGPNSEIHIDLTPHGDGGAKLVNAGDARCIEIWNLVFIQFNALPDGTFEPLPAKHVDTGMGFERVCSMIQCTKGFQDFTRPVSNYETDAFSPIFRELEKLSGQRYTSTLPRDSQTDSGASVPACEPSTGGIKSFSVSRRRLPHWQSPGSVYFVTFRTHEQRQLTDGMRDLILKACRFADGRQYRLYAATIMPDHVHLLLQPVPMDAASSQTGAERGYHSLSEILHSIKSFTANQIQRQFQWQGAVWQHESYDRIVRDDAEFDEKWNYIANNAVKKGLGKTPDEYPFFWFSSEGAGGESVRPQAGTLAPPSPDQIKIDIAFRVIADHIRCLSFAIADGILPSNEGRGYVLRRILRRAVRYGRNLGFKEPFFYKLVDVVAANFGDVFPELRRNKAKIQSNLKAEEESFNRTLDRGMVLFEATSKLLVGLDKIFPAKEAFMLYDTYGFPLDLTELLAREQGQTVDVLGFEQLMDEQRKRAREDYDKKKTIVSGARAVALEVEPTPFLGYDNLESEAVVKAVGRGPKEIINIILNQTPFYAEMGGQVGDTGWINLPGYDTTGLGRFEVVEHSEAGRLVRACGKARIRARY